MANRMGPARNRKYRSLYGFPTGSTGVLQTLRDFLLFVATTAPTRDDLPQWFVVNLKPAPTQLTAFHYTQMLMRFGLYKRDGERYAVTREGREWLETGNHGMLLSLLTRRFDFIADILSALADSPRSVRELFCLAIERGYEWREEIQVSTRLFWLHAVGVVSRNGDVWALSGPYFLPLAQENPSIQEEARTHIKFLSGLGSVQRAPRNDLMAPTPSRLFRQRKTVGKTTLTAHEIESRAVDIVIADLCAEGFSLDDIYQSAPGMGLDLIVLADNEQRLIEVKGTAALDPQSVSITGHELEAMRQHRDRMWLYVVSDVGRSNVLTKLRNPGALDATPIDSYRLRLPSKS